MSLYIDRAEVLRYLGCPQEAADGSLLAIIEQSEAQVESIARPRCTYIISDKKISPVPLLGESITAHLGGCDRVIFFAATLGIETDRLIRRLQIDNMTAALAADAAASAYIEAYCSEQEELIAQQFSGEYLTWRFSPGYGDFPLSVQTDFIRVLSADRRIGLCENDSHALTPRKSVTAVMGISSTEIEKSRRCCTSCANFNFCLLRKEGGHCGF